MLETARKYLDGSRQEVKAAKAQLKEAKNRWKVIDVYDINGMLMAASTKWMKVSVSPSEGIFIDGVRQIDAPLAAIAIGSSISTGSGSIRGTAHISNNSPETIHTSNSTSGSLWSWMNKKRGSWHIESNNLCIKE